MLLHIDADATSPLGPTIALDLRNGATLWTRPGNGYANVPDTSTSLYEMADSTTAIRIADVKPLWNLPIPFPDDSGPRPRSTRSASTTFLNAAVGNLLHTIDATTGQVLWTRPTVQAEPQLQATADTVFLPDGPLPTLDQRTGTLRWTTKPLPGSLEPALVTVAGMVVTGIVATGGAAGLSAWDMADGRPLWHYPHPAGQLDQDWTLVISGDYLIAFFDADLLVFRPARGTHAPTWESGGGDSIYRA